MEVIVNAALVKSADKIEKFQVKVNENNQLLVKAKLKEQRDRVVNILKQMQKEGLIKSIYIPKNKKIKEQLNELVTTKRLLKQSIKKIIAIFN